MKEIILKRFAGIALIDDCFYDYLNQWLWYNNGGYACRSERLGGKIVTIRMHIEIMKLLGKHIEGLDVDHIDTNRSNNQE